MLTIVSAPSDLSLSKSAIKYLIQASDDMAVPYSSGTIPNGYEITIQIYFEKTYNSSIYDVVATLKSRPNANGTIEVDVSRILDSETQAAFPAPPIPDFNATDPYLLPTYKRFYIAYKEDYVGFAGAYANSSVKSLLYGGQYREGDFFADRDAGSSILALLPNLKQIDYNQPEFIAWYNWTGNIKRVYVESRSVDQAGIVTTTLHYSGNTIDIQPGQVMVFPVGLVALGLGTAVREYSVQVVEQTTDIRVSEKVKYLVDSLYKRHVRYLCFLNIFAAPVVVRCTGAQDRGLEINRQIAEVLQNNNSILRWSKSQFSVDFGEYFLFRTGYYNLDELRALDDMLIHNQLFEIFDGGFTAILIETDSFRYSEDDFLFSLEFKCVPAASQTFGSGLAAVNWDLSNVGGGSGGRSLQAIGYDQLFPEQQTQDLNWTRNNGELPTYTRAFLHVYEDGVRLLEGRDYSVNPNTGPGQSTISILPDSFIQGANYLIIGQFFITS